MGYLNQSKVTLQEEEYKNGSSKIYDLKYSTPKNFKRLTWETSFRKREFDIALLVGFIGESKKNFIMRLIFHLYKKV